MKKPINLGEMACTLSKHLPKETTDEQLIGICAWLASFAMRDSNDRQHLLGLFLIVKLKRETTMLRDYIDTTSLTLFLCSVALWVGTLAGLF